MTHDAGMNDSEDSEGAGDAVAAFDALRLAVETQGASLAQQIADLRRGVEAASEGIDKIGRGSDTRVDLARIMKRGSFTQRYVKRHGSRPPFRPDFEVPGCDPAENIGRRPSSRL